MSSVPKQSPVRPASGPKKDARKTARSTTKPTTTKLSPPAKSASLSRLSKSKPTMIVESVEEDLSKYVPSKSVLSRGLKIAKVNPAWLDDDYAVAKPKKK